MMTDISNPSVFSVQVRQQGKLFYAELSKGGVVIHTETLEVKSDRAAYGVAIAMCRAANAARDSLSRI